MTSRRMAKVARAIQETVSSAVLFEVKDPRVSNASVTVVAVDVSGDVRQAKVYVSIMGDEKEQSLCLRGLQSARGFLQAKIADRLQTRYTPILTFVLDQGIKRSVETSRLIREALGENTPDDSAEQSGEEPETVDDEAHD
jgi:ribosome-binding factor A